MTSYDILVALNDVDEEHIKNAKAYNFNRTRIKWSGIAACLCICTIISISIWRGGIFEKYLGTPTDNTAETDNIYQGDTNEVLFYQSYIYVIDTGDFSEYVGGKVIDKDKIGKKLADVTLTAGWKSTTDGDWLSQEKLRGELYFINGINTNVAVALKFLDEGEALTTTHYYVIMNPNADLSSVEEYIITPLH